MGSFVSGPYYKLLLDRFMSYKPAGEKIKGGGNKNQNQPLHAHQ